MTAPNPLYQEGYSMTDTTDQQAVTVAQDRVQFCINAIAKLQPHKARFEMEKWLASVSFGSACQTCGDTSPLAECPDCGYPDPAVPTSPTTSQENLEVVAKIIDHYAFADKEILRSLGSFDERPQRQRAALDKATAILAALASASSASAEGRVKLPPEIAEHVLSLGKVEWGQTPAHDAEGHGEHVARSVRLTAQTFGQTEDQHMHGLWLAGTETVLCHTGTSPNAPKTTQALVGAWNWLVDQASASPEPVPATNQAGEVERLRRALQSLRGTLQGIANAEGDTDLGRRCIAAIGQSRVSRSSATQPATSHEGDDADRANGVGQDELVAGLKRALQHPAGDHDGWTDAGMEDAFFRWPVIVNALNEAMSSQTIASDEACNEDGTTDFHRSTQPATSQEPETMNQKYPVPKNATELSAAVAILLADKPSELKPACKLMPLGFRCTLGAEHAGPCSVLAEASAEGVVDRQSWQPISTADRYGYPSLDLYDPAHKSEYGVSWDGYWNDADGTDHPETGGHWVAAVWCNSCSEWHATRINPTHWRARPAAPIESDLSKFPNGAFDDFDVDAIALGNRP